MTDFLVKVQKFLGQKTTIVGLATVAGGLSAYASGQINGAALISTLVAAAVAIALPENPNAPTVVGQLVTDVITAEQTVVKPAAGAAVTISPVGTVPVKLVGESK